MQHDADAERGGAPQTPASIAPVARGAAAAPVALGAPGSAPPEFHGLKLSLFQLQAIEAIRAGRNVLVSAPTGAGKTLIAEYAIEDAVQRGRRAIYTAPIKALSNQKYRDFRDGSGLDVGLMTGDVTIQPGAQVLVMTTEILRNAILENPDQLADVEYVVLDEVHYMDDVERGSVWEESLIFAPAGIRFISLSATIANLDQFGAWMRSIRPHDLAVVRSDRRPVPLKHRLYHGRVGLFDLRKADWARGKVIGSEREGQREHRRQRRGRDGRDGRRGPELDTRADTSAVLDQLQKQGLLPALVFSFSRKDCERLAQSNQRRALLDEAERARMVDLQERLVKLFQLDAGEMSGEIFELARRGLGYHHAGMLPIHKEVVERMFTSGLLKLLFTTETFALGINMPARTAVFHALRKFDGVSFDYVRTREYLQMAGRAGRQGIDKEGLVISVLSDRDIEEAPLERLLAGKPEPVESRFRMGYSTILHLVEKLGRGRLFEAWEKSFDYFQHRAKSQKAREMNREAQRRLLDAQLRMLQELHYVEEGDRLTARGKIARILCGYELQITEMLFTGALEHLSPEGLASVFVALIHEERRRFQRSEIPRRLFGPERRAIDQMIGELEAREQRLGVSPTLKTCCWALTPAVVRWMRDAERFEDLEQEVEASLGDLCRCFRMAIQLMRQVRRTIDPAWDLCGRLEEAVERMNRDAVDARAQLELGRDA